MSCCILLDCGGVRSAEALENCKRGLPSLRATGRAAFYCHLEFEVVFHASCGGTQRRKIKTKATPKDGRGTPNTSPLAFKTCAKVKAVVVAKDKDDKDDNMASVLTKVPNDVDVDDDVSYLESKKIYEDHWAHCIDSYIFGVNIKYTININELETLLENINVRALKEGMIKTTFQFYLEMLDLDNKVTLCVMPQNLKEKPKLWNNTEGGKFWMVNGQHNVEDSKHMKDLEGVEVKCQKFKTWDCYVV